MLKFADDDERRRHPRRGPRRRPRGRARSPPASAPGARDGELRILDAHAEVVHGPDGEPVGLHGFVQDITALERAAARQRSLAEIGQAGLSGMPLDELLEHTADAVLRGLGVEGAMLLELLPGGRGSPAARCAPPTASTLPDEIALEPGDADRPRAARRRACDRDDWSAEPHAPRLRPDAVSSAVVVIGGADAPFGVLAASSTCGPPASARTPTTFLQALADVVADAVERRRAATEIAELSAARGRLVAQALDAEERARRTISETLHDGPLQELLAATHDLYALTGRGGDDAALTDAQERLAGIARRLREVMVALHPTVLQSGGLEAALLAVAEQQAHEGGFRTEVSVEPEAARQRDELLLSVARELLTNAAKHARASHVTVAVRRDGDELELEVADDGRGVTAPDRAGRDGHTGLAACRERMEAVGGVLALDSRPGAGTRVRARAPATAVMRRVRKLPR